MSEIANRPPGRSTRSASRKTCVLVGGQVDDAVGDDDVDGVVGQRDVLDGARAGTRRSRRRPWPCSRWRARASRVSCRGRRPCRSGRPAERRAARRCRRRSRGRGRRLPGSARRASSGCRSRARRAGHPPGSSARSSSPYCDRPNGSRLLADGPQQEAARCGRPGVALADGSGDLVGFVDGHGHVLLTPWDSRCCRPASTAARWALRWRRSTVSRHCCARRVWPRRDRCRAGS